jgi:hypothetical protein
MHPYHNYAVLFDKDFHKMIEQELKSNLSTNSYAYNKIKAEIEILEKKNKATEFDLIKLRSAENILSQSQATFNFWNSKQVTRITEDQKEALFGNKTAS